MKIANLSELQLDALQEVGNIGAGHAATALSQLVDRPIAVTVPELEVVGLNDLPRVFGGPETLVTAVYARLAGDLEGGILFMAERRSALALVDLMRGMDVGSSKSLGDEEESMLGNVSSILLSAYLAAVGRMTGLTVMPSQQSHAFDMAGALLQAVVIEMSTRAEHALFIRTSFINEGERVEGALFLLPEPESLSIILGRIGVA